MEKIRIPDGMEIRTLLFDKTYYPSYKKIKQWIHLWGLKLPNKDRDVIEDENCYKVKVNVTSEAELGTFRILNLSEGIKAVIAKKKRKNSAVRLNPNSESKKYFKNLIDKRLITAKEELTSALENVSSSRINLHQMPNPKNPKNPIHFPKSKKGRPRKRGRPTTAKKHKIFARGRKPHVTWWVLDLYDVKDSRVNTLIGQGDKDQARHEAQNYVGKHSAGKKIYRVELCGPYYFKPSKDVVRK